MIHDSDKILSNIQTGFSQIFFPNVCLVCGRQPTRRDQHICSFCLHNRFETAITDRRESSSGVILPDRVTMQQALWKFDKAGLGQKLIHHLKYERLTNVGRQLGSVLARRLNQKPVVQKLLSQHPSVLIPVPLHPLKLKRRGFNQSFYIAKGVQQVLAISICEDGTIIRQKNTKSQTGFSLQKRIDNMREAFCVKKPEEISAKTVIIVDDVFTTGATSFELAKTLIHAGAESAMIWTIAQA